MNDAPITIDALHFSYNQGLSPAIADLSATIGSGIITGLIGPDGAGKTTLLRLMSGLLLPSSGSLWVFGHDTRSHGGNLHSLISYMPQKFGLYEELSVRQNLRLYADLRDVPQGERTALFTRLLAFTGLEPFQKRLAGQLSGGMKQKLGLACALIRKPRLLLLDEPGVGVDPISRRELWRMVQELVDAQTTVIWSTAYLDEAERCQDVLLLDNGRLLFSGQPQEMTGRMADRCFQVRGISGNRRQVLSRALLQQEVQDGVIQGQHVRMIMTRDSAPPPLSALAAGPEATIASVPPRFEDAYVDALGGGPGGVSALAASMPTLPDGPEVTVEADNLSKRFGDFTAARDISFRIRRGEIYGLLGPNGAGKSTTFKMMCGLLRPSSGSGRVAGLDLQRAPGQARSRLGYMAQKFSLYGDLSTRQNLEFFSGIYGLEGRRKSSTISQMIEVFGLAPHLQASAKDLPLGFKQRLALACAVMHEPPVLFLDEPTSGVDPLTRREFWTHINGLVEKGVTVLVTTHFMDEAEYCDRIGLIYRGQMIAEGAPDALKDQAQSASTPDPTLEDTFIALLQRWDQDHGEAS